MEGIDLVNSVIISDHLTQMANFHTRIPDCDPHSPAPFGFIYFICANICSTMAFPPLGNSDHVGVPVSMYFLSNSKWDAPFHHIAYAYSQAD